MTSSDQERRRRAENVIHAASKYAPAVRQVFLDQACGGDDRLRHEVDFMLAQGDQTNSLPGAFLADNTVTMTTGVPLPGQEFGPYRIVCLLGIGGMGEVYRAHDGKLGRDVALKTLPYEFACDPGRLTRLRNEARTLASLNHPNIAAIYGLEEFCGRQFLVMELVEGETLAERVNRAGPLPLQEALQISSQVAEGLEAAHLKGVIHRDVKPGNIKVTPAGRVKVLDFGLAKAVEGAAVAQDVSQVVPVTECGRIVGTPSYMSPEHARGKPVDQRTDVWAVGCVLFELLTGKRAFRGETNSDIMVAILDREPPWGALPATTPARIRNLLGRCLQKDVGLRFQEMREVRLEVEAIRAGRRSRRSMRTLMALVAVLAVAAGAALVPGVRHSLRELIPVSSRWRERHLAVLPFLNVGNDPANQVFCDGLVESLTSSLSQFEGFHASLLVVPSAEVRRQSVASPSQAQRSFGVNLAVTGSVQRTGDEVRVTVNLVDTRTLRQVGSREVGLRRDELFKMEDSLPSMVAELLDMQLTPQASRVLDTGGTRVSDAYDAYLRGRGYLRRYDKQGNLELAITTFKDALQRDSRYGLAYAGLGEAYWRNFDRTKSPEWLELAREANSRAIELSDRIAPAHVNLGMTYVSSGRYDAAVLEFQRALEIDSLNPDAYRELANAYEATNKIKDAEATYQRAIQLRPNDWLSNSQLGAFYYRHGRYAEAEPLFRKVIALTPDNVNGYSNLGGLYVAWGRYGPGEALLKQAVQVKPSDPRGYSNLGTLYFQLGRYPDAVPMFEQAVARSPGPNYTMFGNLADSYRQAPGFQAKAPQTYQHAIELAEQQLAINPNNAAVLSSVAVYRAKLGEKDQALHNITLARGLAPADATIAFKAVLVLELLLRRADALGAIEELLKNGRALDQIQSEPELRNLRRDPTFLRLMSQYAALPTKSK
jgi:serine/threonine-protein kinase